MNRKKGFICSIFCLLLICLMLQNVTAAEASTKQEKARSGWFQKGNSRYYRLKNGKLCKKSFVKIGKYYYSFGKSGKMQSGWIPLTSDYSGYFSSKTGRLLYKKIDLKITKTFEGGVYGKSKRGDNYYVPFRGTKWVDKNGKRVKNPKPEKNGAIRVFFKKGTRESSPATFQEIIKVKMNR